VNEAYRDVVGAYDWPTKYGRDVVQTAASESSSTLQAASAGDTALTANAAVWSTSWSGRKIKIGNEVYDVSAFGTTSTATIADGLVADIADGQEYVVYQDEFSAPSDCAEILYIYPFQQGQAPLLKIDVQEWVLLKARTWNLNAYPQYWCPLGTDASGYLKFGVHRIPQSILNLYIHYLKELTALSSDSDVPLLLPPQAHYLVGKRAKIYAYEYDRDKGQQDRAIMDYEGCLLKETNRLDPDSGFIRLDQTVFGSDAADWVEVVKRTVW
jgi:hypothetical protein